MKDPKKLTGKNLQAAYDNGCSDVKKTLELLHPDFFEKEETCEIGDRFMIYGKEYILSNSGEVKKVILVCLEDGISRSGLKTVKNINNIKKKELSSAMTSVNDIIKIKS